MTSDRIAEIIEAAKSPAIRIEGRTHGALRPKGYGFLTDPDASQMTMESDTLMCVHCQAIWRVQFGSGRERGWCLPCNGPSCGKEACYLCKPFEKRMEEQEARSR